MSWARLDDLYDDHPKVKRAWRQHPRAVGLHVMAITYCARHETDGIVPVDWISEKIPRSTERRACIDTLVTVGLLEVNDESTFRVHDFLDYNQSREEAEAKRANLSHKRSEAGKRGAKARWACHDVAIGKNGKTDVVANGTDGPRPDPTRPDPVASKRAHSNSKGEEQKDEPPDDFPDSLRSSLPSVVVVLQRVAATRNANAVTTAATARAMASYPRRPHLKAAEGLEHWLVHGTGAKRRVKDVVGYYRNQLESNWEDVASAAPPRVSANQARIDKMVAEGRHW